MSEAATFLFADLAGYTALTEAHGDERAADTAAEFCAGVRRLLGDYGAAEANTIGDAILVRVPEANAAVHLAARIVSDFGMRHRALRVRVGMHTGTAVQRDGDWYGAGVNIASRVADIAGPGEVAMTGVTRDAARRALADAKVRPLGSRHFRHVPDPVEVFALVLAASGGDRQLPVDPVCRMAVDPAKSREQVVIGAVEYHFCSATCARAFRADPARYIPDRRHP